MVVLRPRLLALALPALLGLSTAPLGAAPPILRELRTQKVGDVTYFHVQFATPRGMTPGGVARLVPQDGQASHVCRRVGDERGEAIHPPITELIKSGAQPPPAPRQPVPVDGLEFTGRLNGKGEIKFVLFYATERRNPLLGRFGMQPPRGRPRPNWTETSVVLDFGKAERVAVPAEAKERRAAEAKDAKKRQTPWPVRDDLEGLWAVAQIDEFGRLQSEVSEFGFYQRSPESPRL